MDHHRTAIILGDTWRLRPRLTSLSLWLLGLLALALVAIPLRAETRPTGVIRLIAEDEAGERLPFASLLLVEQNRRYLLDEHGELQLQRALFTTRPAKIILSYVGKQTRTLLLSDTFLDEPQPTMTIRLRADNLYLSEVEVTATREPRASNTSILIQRGAIDNIQAYSLADVMQALPGKAVLNTDRHNASFLTLRSSLSTPSANPLDAYDRSKLNDFARNAAFGISYILDGTPLSNNVNMQLDSYGKWGGVKMFDRRFNTDNNEHVASGQDLRLIPASSIESIEVISGVAPAKYGDLSSGAVLINRQAGLSPYYGAVKVQYDVLSASLGKGFSLGGRRGLLNLNLDYLHSTRDKRDRLKTNSLLALRALWTKTLSEPLRWTNTLSVDLSQSLDGLRNDPDETLNRTQTEHSSLRMALRGALTPTSLIDRLEYHLSLSLSRQYDMHEELLTNRDRRIITDDYTSGIHETDVAPPIYVSKLEIEGVPLAVYSTLEAGRSLSWGGSTHGLSLGLFGQYEANLGRGKIFDPQHPFYDSGVGGRGDRSYDFRNKVRLLQYGAYLQDRLRLTLGGSELRMTAGLRLEAQRSRWSVSPRLNSSLMTPLGLSLSAAYGLSYKIPPTAYLYPEPVYFDRLLFGHYDADYARRLYLYQTKVIDPTNHALRSPHTHSAELGVTYRKGDFSTSLTAYLKVEQDGISSRMQLDTMWVQRYHYTGEEPSGRPTYAPDGAPELVIDHYYQPQNLLYSRSSGLELVGQLRELRPLGLSIAYSVVYSRSYFYSKGEHPVGQIDRNREAVIGIFPSEHNQTDEVISTLTLTKQIPAVGLILSLRLQNFWYRHYERMGYSIYPVAYYDRDFHIVRLTPAEAEEPRLAYLRRPDSEPVNIHQPIIIPNCHLRLSKELGTRLRLSCYVNNVFNYRPWVDRYGTRIYFNQPPSLSLDLSYRI